MFHSNSILGPGLVLVGLFAIFATSQIATGQTAAGQTDGQTANGQSDPDSAESPQSTSTTSAPKPRRPPAARTVHGSIYGSQANPLADHPLARLFDRISEQNRLGSNFTDTSIRGLRGIRIHRVIARTARC